MKQFPQATTMFELFCFNLSCQACVSLFDDDSFPTTQTCCRIAVPSKVSIVDVQSVLSIYVNQLFSTFTINDSTNMVTVKDINNCENNALFDFVTVVLLRMRMCQTSYVCSTITRRCQWCCHQACSLNNESVSWSAVLSRHSIQINLHTAQLQTNQSLQVWSWLQSIPIELTFWNHSHSSLIN